MIVRSFGGIFYVSFCCPDSDVNKKLRFTLMQHNLRDTCDEEELQRGDIAERNLLRLLMGHIGGFKQTIFIFLSWLRVL